MRSTVSTALLTVLFAACVASALARPALADTYLLRSGSRIDGDGHEDFDGPDGKTWKRVSTAFGTVTFPAQELRKVVRSKRGAGPLRVTGIHVTMLGGVVEASRDGESWRTLSPRERLGRTDDEAPRNTLNGIVAPGDIVRTGPDGEADFDIGWGVVHLGRDSRLVFAEEGAATMRLLEGEAGARLDRLPADARFEVETPQASMGVRGTTFLVRVAASTHLAVEEGEVRIAGGDVAVTAGEAADVAPDGRASPTTQGADDARAFDRLRRTFALPRIDWVRVPAGSYVFSGGQKRITLREFDIGRTEVTNAQWDVYVQWLRTFDDHFYCDPREPLRNLNAHALLKEEPYPGVDRELFQEGDQPAVGMTWFAASSFAAWTGSRLPSETEWEYAARAGGGLGVPYPDGELDEHEWTEQNCGDAPVLREKEESEASVAAKRVRVRARPRAVGSKRPNAFGLHDVLGNVREWVEDVSHEKGAWDGLPTDGAPWVDAKGAWEVGPTGAQRVVRGGSFMTRVDNVTAGNRFRSWTNGAFGDGGLRLVRDVR